MTESYIELGKIVGVWGVKGWVKLHSYTRNRADISQYSQWYLSHPRKTEERRAINVLTCREQGQGIVAQLENIIDRDQAATLNGHKIFVKQADLPKLPVGEYYWQQLIGMKVVNADQEIGAVSSILETGANDVLVVAQVEAGLEDVLIPYTQQTVLHVDLKEGTIVVDWDPAFLLD